MPPELHGWNFRQAQGPELTREANYSVTMLLPLRERIRWRIKRLMYGKAWLPSWLDNLCLESESDLEPLKARLEALRAQVPVWLLPVQATCRCPSGPSRPSRYDDSCRRCAGDALQAGETYVIMWGCGGDVEERSPRRTT